VGTPLHISVAQIIGSVIGKPYISSFFAYQYQIGTMTEKAADTDMCIYLKILKYMLMCSCALSDVYKS